MKLVQKIFQLCFVRNAITSWQFPEVATIRFQSKRVRFHVSERSWRFVRCHWSNCCVLSEFLTHFTQGKLNVFKISLHIIVTILNGNSSSSSSLNVIPCIFKWISALWSYVLIWFSFFFLYGWFYLSFLPDILELFGIIHSNM